MTKLQFLLELNNRLSSMPRSEVEERLNFYAEMIEDRMEEGLSEEEAVAAVGSVDKIASQILQEFGGAQANHSGHFDPKQKPNNNKHRLNGGILALLVLGFPLWFSLLIAAFSIVLSFYVILWSVIISLWAIFASVVGCAVGGIISGAVIAVLGNILPGIALIGAGIFCAGFSILLFFGCKVATKGVILLSKTVAATVKNRFNRKGCIS